MTAAPLALDTSAAIPLLHRSHHCHRATLDAIAGRAIALTGHSLAETYSVLTRLTGGRRLAPADAASLIRARVAAILPLAPATASRLHTILAEAGLAGGQVYDALVALAAKEHSAVLATRDARAIRTYQALGVEIEMLA
ncbi:MAG: PIN domain-containing protein [Bifidobacteriaceae bacterium]|jgi:predicted nucleic acid-binding protein|nr:PIN domain-containing protein [Bifidobacteriaceae bacterium]